ncbi:MAG TPA: hypothetical protein VG871_17520 [Vicinamibacterales bacterium]|nr:hypothetical protein [Vicinamibacterales bacterium]
MNVAAEFAKDAAGREDPVRPPLDLTQIDVPLASRHATMTDPAER